MLRTKHLMVLGVVLCFGPSIFPSDRNKGNQIVQVTSGPVGEVGPQCSPDGRHLAFEYFSAEHPKAVQLWVMPTKGEFSDAKPLLGYTLGESYGEISWSPDSRWLSFIRGTESNGVISDQVFKVNVARQNTISLTKFPTGTSLGAGTSWSKNGQIAFEMDGDIYAVSDSGGRVAKLVDVKNILPGVSPFYPSWSPDRNHVAFVGRSEHERSVYVTDLTRHTIEKIFTGVADDGPAWLDDRHILSSREESQSHSSIWIVDVHRKHGVRVTEGFYDISPATCVSGGYLYFSRNQDIAQVNGALTRGFHIWGAPMRDFSP